MTYRSNTAEGGTSGATVTTGNSGGSSGDAFNALGGTTDPTYTATGPLRGAKSFLFQADSGGTSLVRWTGLSGSDFGIRARIEFDSNPTQSTEVAQVRGAAAAAARVLIANTGQLQVNDAANGQTWLSAAALTPGTTYEFAIRVVPGGSISTGTIQWAYYAAGSNTAIEFGTSSSQNTGTAVLTEARWGKTSMSTWTAGFRMDDLQATDAAGGALLTTLVNRAPTATVTAAQTVAVGGSATFTATATDTDGTIAAQQWVCTSVPSGATVPTFAAGASATVTGAAVGTYTLSFTATDNNGATSAPVTTSLVVTAAGTPTARATLTSGLARIDATASTPGSGGTLTYSISPSAGTSQPTAGVFLVPQTSSPATYTVTAVESGSGATAPIQVVVPAISSKNPYGGSQITIALPTPHDPATAGQWADGINQGVGKILAALNDVSAYLGQ